MAVGAFSSRR